jgi:hypothetical protein
MYNDDRYDKRFNTEQFWSKFYCYAGAVLLSLVVLVAGIGLIKGALSSGEISYCYTQFSSDNGLKAVKVYGFREWCPDRQLGVYASDTEALEYIQKISCRMGIKR